MCSNGSSWRYDIIGSDNSLALSSRYTIITLRPRQHGPHFPDDIFRCIFLNENIWIAIAISLSFVPKGPIGNILALVQTMAWRRSDDKPLSEPMMVSLLTHICVTRPQWVIPNNDSLVHVCIVVSLSLDELMMTDKLSKGDGAFCRQKEIITSIHLHFL